MRKLLLSAATLAAFLAAPAVVADPNGPGDNNQTKQDKVDNQNGGPKPAPMQGPAAQGHDAQSRDRNMPDRDRDATPDRNDRPASAPPNNIMKVRPDSNDNRNIQKTVVRKTVNRTEVLKVRANIQAPRRFHAAAYRRPAGFYVHRWAFGERLPIGFYARDYWISDFALYGLMEPWSGYEWVRVGDDALLVDVETGEVVRVEYGLFY